MRPTHETTSTPHPTSPAHAPASWALATRRKSALACLFSVPPRQRFGRRVYFLARRLEKEGGRSTRLQGSSSHTHSLTHTQPYELTYLHAQEMIGRGRLKNIRPRGGTVMHVHTHPPTYIPIYTVTPTHLHPHTHTDSSHTLGRKATRAARRSKAEAAAAAAAAAASAAASGEEAKAPCPCRGCLEEGEGAKDGQAVADFAAGLPGPS